MERNKPVLIVGSGHLAYRVKKLIDSKGYKIFHISNDVFNNRNSNNSSFENIENILGDIDLSSLAMAYLLSEQDDQNLELIIVLMSLNENLHITASLFNENIAPHLQAAHPRLQILNPAKIAAPVFVEALYKPVERSFLYKHTQPVKHSVKNHSDNLIQKLLIAFGILILFATIYFHVFENLKWLDSLYFVIVTVATVGYGDINLLNASSVSKVVDIILILSATVFIWMIFSLTIDRIIKKRVQLALGRKKYFYKNHVILCGLGRLGYFIAKELLKRKDMI